MADDPGEADGELEVALGEAAATRATLSIALAVGLCSLAFNFWVPFLPLYLIDLGATDEANAIFWVGVATTVQGITRLLTGPIWGILSDKMGRKLMFLRALYFGTGTTLIMVFVTEPWQVAIAFACQGLFSGFVPASVALVSVSVPDSRLNASLSTVTGAQYLGNTVGPAVGALLAIAFGFRGAILVAAMLPALVGTLVIFLVPTDRPARRTDGEAPSRRTAPLEPFRPTFQFAIAVFVLFIVFAMTQLLRIVTPVALKQVAGGSDVEGVTGLAFTLGGLTSAFAVLVLARKFFGEGRMRLPLVVSSILTGSAHLLLALSGTVPLYIAAFALISLLQAAMIPATNTLIAANVSRERRGTGFGVASSAQAIAFMVGPMAAALFAAVSLDLGFVVLAGLFISLGTGLFLFLREPRPESGASASS